MIRLTSRGASVLITTLAFMLIFTMLGLAAIHLSGNNNVWAEKQRMSDEAFWIAEAGIEKVRGRINDANNFTGFNCNANCDNPGVAEHCLLESVSDPDDGSLIGQYCTIVSNGSGVITSTAGFPDLSSANNQKRRIRVGSSLFSFAIFGDDSVCFGSPGPTGCSGQGNNTIINGDVGTNEPSLNPGAATINGGQAVNADVDLPTVNVPSSLTSLTSSGSITDNISLAAGSYKYSTIALGNGKTVTINGNVNLYLTDPTSINVGNGTNIIVTPGSSLTIYADGTIVIPNNANFDNQTTDPTKLIIYSTYTAPDGIDINNNLAWYGAIYAPGTSISVHNNAATVGSFIGNEVYIKNNNLVTYDSRLQSVAGIGGEFIVRIWQELDPNT